MSFKDKTIKSLKNYKKSLINSYVYSSYNKKIKDNLIYIESKNGEDISSNILRIIEELSTKEYSNFEIYLYAKKETISRVESLKEKYNLKIDKIISNDLEATKICETAKYIVTDSKIRFRYIKREGQIVINVYYQNPLKLMGIDNKNSFNLANQQHPFLLSDYILIPNDFTREKIFKSLLIENIFQGKLIMEGNPRNIPFFKKNKSNVEINKNQVFAYIPCYWGVRFHKKFVKNLKKNLKKIDKKLNDDQILFFKIDGYDEKILNFSKFKHIKEFPSNCDIYDILNVTDVLISDYSSILLDFINASRKIILFNQDNPLKNLNYLSNLDLPFKKVDNVNELINELNLSEQNDYSNLLNQFCPYDSKNSAKNICRHIFLNQNCCQEIVSKNNKKDILIYVDNSFNRSNFSSLIGLLSQVDKEKYNITLTFRGWGKKFRENQNKLYQLIPNGINVIPLKTVISPTLFERIIYDSIFKLTGHPTYFLKKMFKREYSKQLYNFSFDNVLNFNGVHKNELFIFSDTDCKSNIWINEDVVEKNLNHKLSSNLLKNAYKHYDNIIVDSADLISFVKKLKLKNDVKLIQKLINVNYIQNKTNEEIQLQKETRIYTNNSHSINGVLSKPCRRVITINRRVYDEEWHENLLNAFDEFCKDYPDTELIIIGDKGSFNKIRKLVFKLDCWKNVTIIKNISNPTAILSKCDLLITNPTTVVEKKYFYAANIFDIPIITTNERLDENSINKFNCYIINNSEESILKSFNEFIENNIHVSHINYNELNNESLNEFNNILE